MKNIGWVDSHTHMNDEVYYDTIAENVTLMKENNVVLANLISYDEAGVQQAFKLQDLYDVFDHSVGIHPQSIGSMTKLEQEHHITHFSDPRVIVIGEIGLDYHWYPEHKEEQKDVFVHQIELANHLKKPVMIHSREAMKDTYDLLYLHRPQYGCVMHCFSGSKEMALKFVDLGFYISLAGVITFKNARVPIEVAQAIPLEHLLVETDAPYLTPVPFRGKQNQAAYTRYVGEHLAKIKNLDSEFVQKHVYENYLRVTQRIK